MENKGKQEMPVALGKELIDAILNNIYIGFSIIDKKGKIVFRNKKLEEISGIRNKDVLNKHFSVIPGKGELLHVLRTAVPQFGVGYSTGTGEKTLTNRIPLILNNTIVGAMSIGFHEDTMVSQKYDLLEQKLEYYEKELKNLRSARYDLCNIVGNSDKIAHVKKLILKYAHIDSPVLITGETGTGKELCAHALHLNSKRKNGPFIKVNCASIPYELFESELFGYEPGAFTNAGKNGKAGKFELANQGTIFLDEISALPLQMQPKLLRVLQDAEIERLGGNKVTKLDLRLISATNKDLEVMVRENKFREDLYYRIKVLSVDHPSLVERKEDIPDLCDHFIRSLNDEGNLKIVGINKEAMAVFLEWRWPGNVRELRNILETAANLNETGVIEPEDLPGYLIRNARFVSDSPKNTRFVNHLKQARDGFEKATVESTLAELSWNKSKAAKRLGISRPQVYALIKKHSLK